MIDSYVDRPNPCTFCVESDIKKSPNEDDEYLELSLCGNNTALFVREVSAVDLTQPKQQVIPEESIKLNELQTKRSSSPLATTVSFKSCKQPSEEVRSSPNLQINALYTRKWSGNTYFEEELRRLREEQYKKELKGALKMRKLWHNFQKEILRDRRREVVRSSGPEWWQEPSRKQIVLASTLRDVIKADYEEGVTGRTRQWLLDLGVTVRLTSRQIRRCMKRSLLEPVDFLLETHSLIVKSQLHLKKKKGELQRPFSINERLLLTAVCVLQLPTLLTMLHYILPPPKPQPADKRLQEILYGDLDDETIRYSTPYMEPLPFRNRQDFTDWAFDKIYNALLPTLLQDDYRDMSKEKSVISEKTTSEWKVSTISQQKAQAARLSAYSVSPSIAVLLSYCLSKRQKTDSLQVNVDYESHHFRTFDRRLSGIAKLPVQPKHPEHTSKIEQSAMAGQASVKSLEAETLPVSRKETPTITDNTVTADNAEPFAGPYQPFQQDYAQASWANANVPSYSNPPYYYDMYGQEAYYERKPTTEVSQRETIHTVQNNSKSDRIGSKVKIGDKESHKTLSKVTEDSGTTGGIRSEGRESIKSVRKEENEGYINQELENVWEEIGALPEKDQLQGAIKLLSGMGDPLAQLPRIHELPTIQRWLELRRGKNRILTKNTKHNLLNRSRGMWKSVHFANSTRGPKIDISKNEERKLTWDKKKWLESEVEKEKQSYFTRIRGEKVDNARSFYPTMLNHYDYGSKLNRNFRDIYFTYLPAREADMFVYRPWQPQETNNSKS